MFHRGMDEEDEEPDVIVEVYKGEALIATNLIGSPATAGEVKQGLVDKNATWRGDLTPHNSSTGLVGQRKLKGGAIYHLHLHEQPGESLQTLFADLQLGMYASFQSISFLLNSFNAQQLQLARTPAEFSLVRAALAVKHAGGHASPQRVVECDISATVTSISRGSGVCRFS